MTFTLNQTNAQNWAVANPASVIRELFSIDRIKKNKTGLYEYLNSTFSLRVNTNARLFEKQHLNTSVCIVDYATGDLTVLLPKIFAAVNRANSAAIFIPTDSTHDDHKQRSFCKKTASAYKKMIPHTLKKSALESDYPTICPFYVWIADSNPYRNALLELTND